MHTASSPATATRVPAYPWHQSKGWYTKNKRYFAYMLRELTAVFVAIWVILFLAQIPAMGAGPENLVAHSTWVYWIHSTEWVIFSVITLGMVLFHAITWINLMGTVMWMRFGKAPVPGRLIVTTMFLAWLGASLIIAFFIATPVIGS